MTQTIDFRFELLFLLCVLLSLLCLIATVVLMLRGRRSAAGRILKVLGIGWVVYLSIVFLVAAFTPQRIVPMNQDLCFDEMCFAAVNLQTARQVGPGSQPVQANGIFYIVTVRASSSARGRAQSEQGLRALLWSPSHEYQISSRGQQAWDKAHPENVGLTARLQPGQSILSDQVFDVESRAPDLGLELSHGFTPGYFVIGECPLFYKPTILRLARETP
ncbi:MAG: hypothetical protein JO051_04735 [Acidobacteriaceae bacterium]|nr:hypothetical protein [Acidobacteriaceae bacterium]